MKKSFRVATVFTGAVACAAAFAPGALAAPATPGATITTAAAGQVTTPTPAAIPCVDQTFGQASVYRPCVLDLQVLLNDLYNIGVKGPDQRLSTDGYYGSHTANDVRAFNDYWTQDFSAPRSVTVPATWASLCFLDSGNGFQGAYWHNAGCSIVAGPNQKTRK
jgi:hypothetical protein